MEKVKMKATQIRDKIMEWLGFHKKINPLTGETSWYYGGITEITVQINEHVFKVKPQPADHEDGGFDVISQIIKVFG